jgi:multidrug resistance efflux pump
MARPHHHPGSRPRLRTRTGQITLLIVGGVAALVVVGIAALLIGGGSDASGGGGGGGGSSDRHIVRRGGFQITIPVLGELQAQEQIEIRNRMDTQAIITEIIPEGTWANTGDVLLRLNDEELRNKVNDARDAANVAQAETEAADAELRITQKEQESEESKAQLAVTLAELALKAWSEGEHPAKRSELSLALETAEKDYARLQARFEESKKLVEQKFISVDEFRQDEISLIEARAKLERAKLDIDVYDNYQYHQDKATKESDLEQATGELERTKDRFTAQVHSAQTDRDSKKYQLESKKERLRLFEQQLAQCVQKAPSPGLVVYSSSLESGMRWGGNEGPPQVGTQLWPNQLVIILPNTERMVAAVKVSEALSGLIRPGQKATVVSDAMPDQSLPGEVISVGVMAESGGWRDPNRRDYTVRISLGNGNSLGLKPAMRCKAEVDVGRVSNALFVPIQAVFRTGPLTYVYVPQGRGFAQRKVEAGRASELFIEITSGLEEGDTVLLREPAPEEVVSRLPEPKRDERIETTDAEAPQPTPPPAQPVMIEGASGAGAPATGDGAKGGGDSQRSPRSGRDLNAPGDRPRRSADGGSATDKSSGEQAATTDASAGSTVDDSKTAEEIAPASATPASVTPNS